MHLHFYNFFYMNEVTVLCLFSKFLLFSNYIKMYSFIFNVIMILLGFLPSYVTQWSHMNNIK